MDMQSVPEAIRSLYSCAWIRGTRITRLEEQTIGRLELGADTAWRLGRNNVGVFVGGCWSFDDILRRLARLESTSVRPSWVVVAATNTDASTILRRWFFRDVGKVATSALTLPRQHRNIILATPGKLRHVGPDVADEVGGIILIDEACIVYRARGHEGGPFYRNNRPQHVAGFRNRLLQDGWAPPLFIMTRKPAKSVNTDIVARAFCLDAFWFVDGSTLGCGPPSITKDVRLDAD